MTAEELIGKAQRHNLHVSSLMMLSDKIWRCRLREGLSTPANATTYDGHGKTLTDALRSTLDKALGDDLI